jgi:PAS domain S-box-containing protein
MSTIRVEQCSASAATPPRPTRQSIAGAQGGTIKISKNIPRPFNSEERVLLIDSVNAPVFGVDTDGRINEWNLKAAETVGYSSDEVMGRDLVEEFISPDHRVRVKEVLDDALRGRDTANFDFPLFTKSQERVDVLLNTTTRRAAGGHITGMVGVGQDVTDRKKAEAELAQMALEMLTLIDSVNAPIFGIDNNGRVNQWNLKAAELVGYSSDEVMGRDFVEDFVNPEFRGAVKEVLDNALKGLVTSAFEFPLFSKVGVSIELLLNASPRRNAVGVIVGVVGISQDMTEVNPKPPKTQPLKPKL